MMFPSHLLATLLACGLFALVRRVRPRDWALAIAFGVAIDLDHLLQIPAYLATHAWSDVTPTQMSHWGAAWQGFMHTPWALVLVLPASLLFRSWFPVAFWGLHMFQDFVIATRFVGFGSATEWAIIAALAGAVALLIFRDHRVHGRGARLRDHLLARAALVWAR